MYCLGVGATKAPTPKQLAHRARLAEEKRKKNEALEEEKEKKRKERELAKQDKDRQKEIDLRMKVIIYYLFSLNF